MKFFRSLLAGAAFVALSASAQAGQIVQVYLVGGGTPSVTTDLSNVAFTNYTDGTTRLIQLFDKAAVMAANPGMIVTLTDVQLTMNTVVQTGGTLTNKAAQAQDFSFELFEKSFATAGDTSGAGSAAQTAILTYFGLGKAGARVLDFGEQDYSAVASGTSVTYPDPNSAGKVQSMSSAHTAFTDSTSLAAFTGTGGFGLNLNTRSTQSTSGGGGNVAAQLNTTAGGAFGVVYDYTLSSLNDTVVPEPASVGVLGAGMAALGLLRRRKA